MYDEAVAERIRTALKRRRGVSERKMFGGIAFMVNGNMCCGVVGKELMLRLGEKGADRALDEPHTRVMDFTGTPMKSMIYVKPKGFASDDDLRAWLDRAVAFARSLPPRMTK